VRRAVADHGVRGWWEWEEEEEEEEEGKSLCVTKK
jgi:hypothetical protein